MRIQTFSKIYKTFIHYVSQLEKNKLPIDSIIINSQSTVLPFIQLYTKQKCNNSQNNVIKGRRKEEGYVMSELRGEYIFSQNIVRENGYLIEYVRTSFSYYSFLFYITNNY